MTVSPDLISSERWSTATEVAVALDDAIERDHVAATETRPRESARWMPARIRSARMPMAATGMIPASTASSVSGAAADRREDRLAEVVDADRRADRGDRDDHDRRLADAPEHDGHRKRELNLQQHLAWVHPHAARRLHHRGVDRLDAGARVPGHGQQAVEDEPDDHRRVGQPEPDREQTEEREARHRQDRAGDRQDEGGQGLGSRGDDAEPQPDQRS